MNPNKIRKLKKTLIDAELEFLKNDEIQADAIGPALRYKLKRDREFAAFVSAVLAYGKVQHIKMSVNRILDPLGRFPVSFLRGCSVGEIEGIYAGWKHRFNTADDATCLMILLKSIYAREESLEEFMCGSDDVTDIKTLLENFVIKIEQRLRELKLRPKKSFWFFFPKPSSGSACKRLNLFLRWMAGTGPFDLALWTKVPESRLYIPLDVHLLNQARSLRMTRRRQADWKTVEEVTEKMRLLDEEKPIRFDFVLCHLGISGRILAGLSLLLFTCCQTAPQETSLKSAPVIVKRAQLTTQDEARFLRAVRDDDVNQVHFFLSMGVDINKTFVTAGKKETALLSAIESKSKNTIRLLLDSAAKPDALDDPNQSELITSILTKQDLVALELIDKGANFDKVLKETGETALMSAARTGLCAVLRTLIDRGAKVDMQNKDGYTSLMYASEYGRTECVGDLLKARANSNLRNRAGKTAEDLRKTR